MPTPTGRPILDAWFAEIEEVTAEVANLHDAGVHDHCWSLPIRRAQHLRRRLIRLLLDLGLETGIGEWVDADRGGLSFGPLNHRQAEKLISALEVRGGKS